MASTFNDYSWNGAPWNGSTDFVVLDFMQVVCIEAVVEWEIEVEAIVEWEVSIVAEIPRC